MTATEILSNGEKKKPGRPKGSTSKPKPPEISDAELRVMCLKLIWERSPRLRLVKIGPMVEDLMDYARTGDYGTFNEKHQVTR